MGRVPTLFIISLAFATSPAICDDGGTEPCPYWRGFHSRWEGNGYWFPWPGMDWLDRLNFTRSVCLRSETKVFSRAGTYTTVYLRKTNESWNQDPRRDAVLEDIQDAINISLHLFGDHAGNATHPLDIHITIADVTRQKQSQSVSRDVFLDEGILFNSWGSIWGIARPCEMVIGFQDRNFSTQSTIKTKKNLVKNLYHCVQQYYHPKIDWDGSSRPWWHESVARFFDGLVWPLPPDVFPARPPVLGPGNPEPRYPEEYDGFRELGLNQAASALLWHWAHNTGWSPARITSWMKSLAFVDGSIGSWEASRSSFAADPELSALFHSFARAAVMGNITYPTSPTPTPIRLLPKTGFRSLWPGGIYWPSSPPLRFRPGEERDIVTKDRETLGLESTLYPWEITLMDIPLAGGQVLEAEIRHRDYVWTRYDKLMLDPVRNASVYRGYPVVLPETRGCGADGCEAG